MLRSKPLITVCLPVYEGAAFLAETLDSILSQSVQDFEVLVPDDCSSDESFTIVEDYARQDARIKCWKNPKRYGLFGNYNQCLMKASGLYIKPMAQDDVLLPDMFEWCVRVLTSHKDVSLVSTGRTVVDESGATIPCDAETPETLLGRQDVYQREQILTACLSPLRNIIGEPCTVLFKSEGASRRFSEKLFHLGDLEFWIRLLEDGNYSYIPQELVKFRRHRKSATSRNMAQLRIASDIVQFARLLSPTLAELGSSEREFILANISHFAAHMYKAMEAGAIDEDNLVCDEPISREEELGLKKFLLSVLFSIAESDCRSIALRDAYSIAKSEAALRSLLESFPWRVTRILREVNQLVSSLPKAAKDDLDAGELQFDKQQDYLRYLRLQRRKIAKSKSWRVGQGIRILSLPFSQSARRQINPLRRFSKSEGSEGSEYWSFFRSSKRISSHVAERQESDLLLNDLDRLHDIEPLVPAVDSLGSLTQLRTPLEVKAGRAYFKLSRLLEDPFSHLFLIPSLIQGQAERGPMDMVRCVAERLGSNAPLVVITDSGDVTPCDRLPQGVRVYVLNSLYPGLSSNDKELLLLRLILQARPTAVTNTDSVVGWNLYKNFGRQLATATHLAACLFDKPNDSDSATGGFQIKYLNHCIDHLSYLFMDSEDLRNELLNRFAFGDADSRKLLVYRSDAVSKALLGERNG